MGLYRAVWDLSHRVFELVVSSQVMNSPFSVGNMSSEDFQSLDRNIRIVHESSGDPITFA